MAGKQTTQKEASRKQITPSRETQSGNGWYNSTRGGVYRAEL